MDKTKKVSILLAVHNGQEFLEDALISILYQDYDNWELIAVENGSTDNTLLILNDWSQKDSRIKVFSNSRKGKNEAFNRAFSECSGDFICYFAADDRLEKSSIKKRINILLENNSFNYSTCLLQTFSEEIKFTGLIFPKNKNKPNYSGGSLMFKRELAEEIFPIPLELPNEDTWTSLFLKYFGIGSHYPEVLYNYRIHSKNSYGYHGDFQTKRQGFLSRMDAVGLFLKRYNSKLSFAEISYLEEYKKAISATRQKKPFLIFLSKIKLEEKLLMFYFSYSFLFYFRNLFFKKFSGLI